MSRPFPDPSLLAHPNIPKPLHGLNPRTLLGKEWWDIQRHAAYAKHDFHCWACGVSKWDADFHRWLEGHESYIISYQEALMELEEIVALCSACHQFVHSDRLWILANSGEIELADALFVLKRGMTILKDATLQPFFVAVDALRSLDPDYRPWTEGWYPLESDVKWGEWRLIIGRKWYEPLFPNAEAWARHYSGSNEHFLPAAS